MLLIFIKAFTNIIDQFVPLRKATTKKKKLLSLNSWITSDLLKSIRIKTERVIVLTQQYTVYHLVQHYADTAVQASKT